MSQVELLAPAGNLDKLKVAYSFGADAVYIGGSQFSLRAKAGNFTNEDIIEAVRIKDELQKKLYVTINIFAHNEDLVEMPEYLRFLDSLNIDALIISDPGIINMCKNLGIKIPIHLSTQANTQNWSACEFFREQGVERVVLGRETTLTEIKEIHERSSVELEVFIHGAMCMSYSGRCMLSMMLNNKSGNSGACTQPCRWEYFVVESKRPGEYMPIEEDERGTYIFNSKDLCALEILDKIIDYGVTSLKVEGRMKSIHYIATVISTYRKAIDYLNGGGSLSDIVDELMVDLVAIGERDYCTGFFLGKPDEDIMQYEPQKVVTNLKFLGLVLDNSIEEGYVLLEQRNKFLQGEQLEFLEPSGNKVNVVISEIINGDGLVVSEAPHPREVLKIKCAKVANGSLLRRRNNV